MAGTVQQLQRIGYWLEGRGIVLRFSAEARVFCLLQSFWAECGHKPASYSINTGGGVSPGVKCAGCESIHSTAPNVRVKNKQRMFSIH